ncbi:MAG: hypothetical protein DRR16_20270 [Candidatus Parabeggiatoa sp. nov. 3]|nr:MAG: hypothetical protein DRR16_20270 [Gammaproteobacteria bacterium]
MPIKLPYGISHFNKLVSENYYYVDRTAYIEKLEQANEPYVFFYAQGDLVKACLCPYFGITTA